MIARLLIKILFFFLTITIYAQDFYWSNNGKINIVKDNKRILVRAEKESNTESLVSLKTSLIDSIDRINSEAILIKLKKSSRNIPFELMSVTENMISSYKTKTGLEMIPTGEVLFMPKKGIGFDQINGLVGGVLDITQQKYGCYTAMVKNFRDLLQISNKIYESGMVEYSHPNFVMKITKNQNDPLYPDQYYLDNTGQFGGTAGIDINAPQAWGISIGLTDIRVAVLDDGVENHTDINGRVLQGFTPTNVTGFGAPTASSTGHGQSCAGIIGATRDNNIGIAGIAPCVDIVPVNIFAGNPSISQVAESIDWAWDEGNADVLSNSWSYASETVYYDNIAQAIGRARAQGRNGRGSVVVFSSGNYNPAGGQPTTFNGVAHPANVGGVVTVGAVDNTGAIQDYSSRGPEMDLVAPSGGFNVSTTDLNNNYTTTFGGTSAACPQVSGVAALMLSVNPNLTESQIISRLSSTATDMGTAGYDNTFGDGRVNAQAALDAALPFVDGPNVFCPSGTFSVDVPVGGAVSWSVDPSNALNFSQGSANTTFTRNGSFTGFATITAEITSNCDGITISKTVRVEADVDMTITNVQPGPTYTISAVASGGNPPYSWYINGVFQKSTSIPDVLIRYRCANAGLSDLEVQSTTGCGLATAEDFFYDDCGSSQQMAVSPNPASSEIFIAKAEDYDVKLSNENLQQGQAVSATSDMTLEIEMFDFSGEIVLHKHFQKSESIPHLNISNLAKGMYFLRIIGKEVDEVHQIVLE
ncbi:MAG: S8 family serine peptidase [Pricia sp.]